MTGARRKLNEPSHHRPVVLAVDDEPEICELFSKALAPEGYATHVAYSAKHFLEVFNDLDVDICLLDLALPDGSGLELARKIRRSSQVGILIVSGEAEDVDKVLGLEMGADDFITKPFNIRELRARVNAVYRRTGPQKRSIRSPEPLPAAARETGVVPDSDSISFMGWSLRQASRSLRNPSGAKVELTTGEFDLLCVLARNPNRVLSREQIIAGIKGQDWSYYDRAIDGLVSRVRSKLTYQGQRADVIKTIRGVGYMLSTE